MSGQLIDHLKEANDQIPFYGNKIVSLGKDLDTAWFESYRSLT
jgi:hypothetical protein